MTTVEKYTQQLTFALRLRDAPGDVIGDAIAQVESHVADSGEDPAAAFGPAGEFAASFGGTVLPARRWPWYVVAWLVGFLLGCVLIVGVFGQVRGEDVLGGLPPIVAILIGAVGLIAFFVVVFGTWADRVKDPRQASHGHNSA